MKNCVVGLVGRVFNGGVDVFPFKERVVGQNLVEACAVGQEFEDVGDAKTLAANAGTAPAFALFDGDSFESVCAHIVLTTPKDTL